MSVRRDGELCGGECERVKEVGRFSMTGGEGMFEPAYPLQASCEARSNCCLST